LGQGAVSDAASLLREGPERAKAEFQRLGLTYTIMPVYEGPRRIFLRAEGSGEFERLAFRQYAELSTADASPDRRPQMTSLVSWLSA